MRLKMMNLQQRRFQKAQEDEAEAEVAEPLAEKEEENEITR